MLIHGSHLSGNKTLGNVELDLGSDAGVVQALQMVRRAYGPDVAASLAERLPAHLNVNDFNHAALLFSVGLTRDRLFNALGAEL